MARCQAVGCTREAETSWITEVGGDQVPVCGTHLMRLANREQVELRAADEPQRVGPSEWVVVVQMSDAPELYYGEGSLGGRFTRIRGDAYRFESENAARYQGYSLKEQMPGRIIDFRVEEIVNPRRISPRI